MVVGPSSRVRTWTSWSTPVGLTLWQGVHWDVGSLKWVLMRYMGGDERTRVREVAVKEREAMHDKGIVMR